MKITYFNNLSDETKADIDAFLSIWQDDSDLVKIKTSGSTGVPKEIELQKSAMLNSAKLTGQFFDFKPGQKNLLALSPNHIAGIMQIVRAWQFDMELLVAPVVSNPLKIVKNESFDFAAFVPFQVEAILKDDSSTIIYESIRNVIIGGAPIHQQLEAAINKCSNQNYATFGMTETISHIALRNIKTSSTLYKGLESVHFNKDKRGCLIINASHIGEGEVVTNDCVDLIDDSSFVWLGRVDHVINSGGIKIHPEQVEIKLKSVLLDNRFYITKEKSDSFGEQVVLVVEGSQWSGEDYTHYNAEIKKALGKFEQPKRVIFITQFQETPTGKLIKLLPKD